MSNINDLVMRSLVEQKGQTAGAEMYNDAPMGGSNEIGGLYDEKPLNPANKAGDPVVAQSNTDQSSFDVRPSLEAEKKRTGTPETKYGGDPLFSKALNLVKAVGKGVIKSPNVAVTDKA